MHAEGIWMKGQRRRGERSGLMLVGEKGEEGRKVGKRGIDDEGGINQLDVNEPAAPLASM